MLKVRQAHRTAWLLECVRMVLSVGAGNRGGGGGGGGRLGGDGVSGWGSTGGAARLVCARTPAPPSSPVAWFLQESEEKPVAAERQTIIDMRGPQVGLAAALCKLSCCSCAANSDAQVPRPQQEQMPVGLPTQSACRNGRGTAQPCALRKLPLLSRPLCAIDVTACVDA